jgi:ABC-type amino acid transport substrate-binding protein
MKKIVLILTFVLVYSIASALTLEDIKWYTEAYPPYNYEENGVLKGIAVETLVAMWKKAGLNKNVNDISLVPWARGVNKIKTIPGTCLFSTTITAERKNVLEWKYVFPIPQKMDAAGYHLIAKKGKGIKFNSVADIQNYDKRIGVVRGDICESLLLEINVNANKFDKAVDPKTLITKLNNKRYDVIAYAYPTIVLLMKELGMNIDAYEVVFTFADKSMGYAFHKSTDLEILKKLQKALDELYLEKFDEQILKKYYK